MTRHWTRRKFLRQAAAGGLAVATGTCLRSSSVRGQKPADKLNLAIIGVGGRGHANMMAVAGEHIVALCDVDRNRLESAGKRFPAARKYTDFRELLDKEKDLDAAVVSTPRPLPRAGRRDGHEARPALLLREAAYALDPRGSRDGPDGGGQEAGHADGHRGAEQRVAYPHGRGDTRGRNRTGQRGSLLDKPAYLAAGPGPARRRGHHPQTCRLAALDRPGAHATVQG